MQTVERGVGEINRRSLQENDWYIKLRPNNIEQIWAAKNRNKKIRGAQNFVESLKTFNF